MYRSASFSRDSSRCKKGPECRQKERRTRAFNTHLITRTWNRWNVTRVRRRRQWLWVRHSSVNYAQKSGAEEARASGSQGACETSAIGKAAPRNLATRLDTNATRRHCAGASVLILLSLSDKCFSPRTFASEKTSLVISKLKGLSACRFGSLDLCDENNYTQEVFSLLFFIFFFYFIFFIQNHCLNQIHRQLQKGEFCFCIPTRSSTSQQRWTLWFFVFFQF